MKQFTAEKPAKEENIASWSERARPDSIQAGDNLRKCCRLKNAQTTVKKTANLHIVMLLIDQSTTVIIIRERLIEHKN